MRISFFMQAAVLLTATTTAWAGVPFVTDDAETPEKGHFEITVAGQYTRNKDEASGVIPSFEVNYGLLENLELHLLLPLAFEHPNDAPAVAGLGDIEIGIKYRFIEADDWGWRPAVAFAPTLMPPTGNANRDLGTGRTHAFLPLWVSKDIGKFTVFGGGGYTINPGPGNRDWWFAGGGATYEINPQWTIGAEVFHTSIDKEDGKSNVSFNLGVIYNISDEHHLMLSAGRGLQNIAENNQFSIFLGYQLIF